MRNYIYKENNGKVSIFCENNELLEWVCDCGFVEDSESWYKAVFISSALNSVFKK